MSLVERKCCDKGFVVGSQLKGFRVQGWQISINTLQMCHVNGNSSRVYNYKTPKTQCYSIQCANTKANSIHTQPLTYPFGHA